MTTQSPDIFTNVHKGIRKALFETCTALGRAGDEQDRAPAARKMLADVLHFMAHHGENEDLLLLPLLEERAPEIFARMHGAHRQIDSAIAALQAKIQTAPAHELYEDCCALTAHYLDHMRMEERELDPVMRRSLSVEEIVAAGRKSVERTAPEDQRMMLGWMLPAMTRSDADAFLSRFPAALAEQLRPMTL